MIKQLLTLVFAFIIFIDDIGGQSAIPYHTLIAKASLYHLQRDYKRAVDLYEKAFLIETPDALTAYKAAGAYALNGDAEKSIAYLDLALKEGWTEAGWLVNDPYLASLHHLVPRAWKEINQRAYEQEREYEKSLTQPGLRKQMNRIALNDQQLRYKRIHAEGEEALEVIEDQIRKADSANLLQARQILLKHGWPRISAVGKDGQNNFWLVIQHADQDVLFQQLALSEMRKLMGSGEITLEHYAFLYDRVQCNLNYKQLYGTQVSWTNNGEASDFRPIKREDLVDERRQKFGLLPLSVYALSHGFQYNNVTAQEAAARDSAELAYTRQLMDSAGHYFARGEFQKTYDFYNAASTVLGAMTNADNFNAAIVFARIAAVNHEQRYKDIALDFLNLLYLRNELTKKDLTGQQEFEVLLHENRWKEMCHALD